MQIVTATQLKSHMKDIFEQSIMNNEAVVIKRPHNQDMALISLAEYQSLVETAYLLGNSANAEHLAKSIAQIDSNKTVTKSQKAFDK